MPMMLLETKNISNSINIVVVKFRCTIGKWFCLFSGVLLYNWQVFQLGYSFVCKISRKNVTCYYKKYFFRIKPYILLPNLVPALINECSDGDCQTERKLASSCNRLPFANGIKRLLNDIRLNFDLKPSLSPDLGLRRWPALDKNVKHRNDVGLRTLWRENKFLSTRFWLFWRHFGHVLIISSF